MTPRLQGQKHGYYLELDSCGSWEMFGRYSRGLKVGAQWAACPGGGCLVGEVDR